VRMLSHQLKGSAGSYGFPSITKVASTIENYVKAGQNREAAALIGTQLAGLCAAAARAVA
jgi:HPt (histidine-containing phosphotransfer) domain-containing protein